MELLKNLLTLKAFTGWRTKIIGGGMILTGLGVLLAHLGAVIGGAHLDWPTLQGGALTVATGFGLITASVHTP